MGDKAPPLAAGGDAAWEPCASCMEVEKTGAQEAAGAAKGCPGPPVCPKHALRGR